MKRPTGFAQRVAHGWAASASPVAISYRRIRDSAPIAPRLSDQDDSAKCNTKWKEYRQKSVAPTAAPKEP